MRLRGRKKIVSTIAIKSFKISTRVLFTWCTSLIAHSCEFWLYSDNPENLLTKNGLVSPNIWRDLLYRLVPSRPSLCRHVTVWVSKRLSFIRRESCISLFKKPKISPQDTNEWHGFTFTWNRQKCWPGRIWNFISSLPIKSWTAWITSMTFKIVNASFHS